MKILKKIFGKSDVKIHVDEIAVNSKMLLGTSIIVDEGENEFGKWTKFGSGLMVCYQMEHLDTPALNIPPNGEWKAGFKFPQDFKHIPSTSVFGFPTDNTGAITYVPLIDISAGNLYPGSWQLALKNTSTRTITKILRINLIAIGRWK